LKIELARLPPGSSKELLKSEPSFNAHANRHSLFQVWLPVIHNSFFGGVGSLELANHGDVRFGCLKYVNLLADLGGA
jgi:hypothetical protein